MQELQYAKIDRSIAQAAPQHTHTLAIGTTEAEGGELASRLRRFTKITRKKKTR